MKPSVGGVVHYVSRGSADGVFLGTCRAAIVTDVPQHDDGSQRLALAVLNPTGLFFDQGIPYNEAGPYDEDGTPQGGSWHWPERI